MALLNALRPPALKTRDWCDASITPRRREAQILIWLNVARRVSALLQGERKAMHIILLVLTPQNQAALGSVDLNPATTTIAGNRGQGDLCGDGPTLMGP